jgi:PAS domain S-box-containing protein
VSKRKPAVLAARYRTILASIGKAVIVTDPESRITFMNPIAEKLTGWVQHDALGKHLKDIFHIVDGESSANGGEPGRQRD